MKLNFVLNIKNAINHLEISQILLVKFNNTSMRKFNKFTYLGVIKVIFKKIRIRLTKNVNGIVNTVSLNLIITVVFVIKIIKIDFMMTKSKNICAN